MDYRSYLSWSADYRADPNAQWTDPLLSKEGASIFPTSPVHHKSTTYSIRHFGYVHAVVLLVHELCILPAFYIRQGT
jgi:hypothetical protein